MKINLSKKDLEKTYHLLDTKEINISIADLLFSTFEEIDFFNNSKTADQFFDRLLKFWDVPGDAKEDIDLLKKVVKPAISPLKADFFERNSYYKTVKPAPFKHGEYELKYMSFKAYQPLPLDEIIVDENDYYLERSPLSYCLKEEQYLALSHKDEVWMSITPNEINTMQPYIDVAKGDVLVLGLGLGYYPFMVSLKDGVKSVTIIEMDKTIIDIFKKNILPFFPHKEKIHIVEADAFNYLKNNKNEYTTVFADLWHNPVDGLPLYIKLKQLEKSSHTIYQYWLEKSLIALGRRCLLTIYEEALENYKDKDYLKAQNQIDSIINRLYFKTKNITINTYDDIFNLLSDRSIKQLIKSLI